MSGRRASRRDRDPPTAARWLRSPLGSGLANPPAFFARLVGRAGCGRRWSMARSADSIGDMLDDSPQLAEIFEQLGGAAGITDAFFATAMGILALIATAYAIRSVLRLRVEEEGLRAEPILGHRHPRLRWV